MDIDNVARVVAMVESSQLHSVSIKKNDQTITVINHQAVSCDTASSATPHQSDNKKSDNDKNSNQSAQICAPYVGYVRLSPDAVTDALVREGDRISQGQTLGYIEQRARLLPIISDKAGIVTDILIEDGQDVEYGQPLFHLM